MKRWMWRVASVAVASSILGGNAVPAALAEDRYPPLSQWLCTAYAATPTAELVNAWQLQRLDTDALWRLATGDGVTVAVIDTGTSTIGSQYLQTPKGRTIQAFNLIPDEKDPQGGAPSYDCDHGTAVTSIIAAGRTRDGDALGSATNFSGIAPDADILAYRTLRSSTGKDAAEASGEEENLQYTIDAIRDATARKVDIINLSQVTFADPLLGELEKSVTEAIDAGVVVVAAAGNQGQGPAAAPAYPASFPGVISVGMSNQQDAGDLMTHVSTRITVGAPGRNLVALRPSKDVTPVTIDNQAFITDASGTSYAAPVVTGVVALMIQFDKERTGRKPTPEEVAERLARTADRNGVRPPHPQLGNGIINPMRALTEPLGASPTPVPVVSEAPAKLPADPDETLSAASIVGLGVAIVSVVLVALGVVAAIAIPAARRQRKGQ